MSANSLSAAYSLGMLGAPVQPAADALMPKRKKPIQGAKGTMPSAKIGTLTTAAQALFGGAL